MTGRILLERQSSSAMKVFYLAVFAVSAISIFRSFQDSISEFRSQMGKAFQDIPPNEIVYLATIVLILQFLTVLHLCRIYVTLELLEEPHSELHKAIIAPFKDKRSLRVAEQLVRLAVIAVVSFKLIPMKQEEGNWFEGIGKYLILLYCILTIWDLLVLFGAWTIYGWPKELNTILDDVSSKSYFFTSFTGLLMAIILVNMKSVTDYTPTVVIAFVLTLIFGFTLLRDIFWTQRVQYYKHFVSLWMDLVNPYYGNECHQKICVPQVISGSVPTAQPNKPS